MGIENKKFFGKETNFLVTGSPKNSPSILEGVPEGGGSKEPIILKEQALEERTPPSLRATSSSRGGVFGGCYFQGGFVLLADVCQQGYRHPSKTLLKYIQKPADIQAKRKKQARIAIICSTCSQKLFKLSSKTGYFPRLFVKPMLKVNITGNYLHHGSLVI